jgi:hypothetical protein
MKKVTVSLAAAMLCFGLAGPAAAATYSFNYTLPGSGLPINDAQFVDDDGGYFDAGLTYFDIDAGGIPGAITDVNVYVDIEHPSIGDLEFYVAHLVPRDVGPPEWEYVQLYNQDAAAFQANMREVTFDDEAGTYINEDAPPYGPGFFNKPTSNPLSGESNQLSSLDGYPAAGWWSLVLYDNFNYGIDEYGVDITDDAGTLLAFRLDIETDVPSSAVPLPGAVVLFGSGLGALAAIRRSRQK